MLDLSARTFTTADALAIAKLTSGTLQNWGARDLLQGIGRVRSGRRLFNVTDLVALRVMSDLTQLCEVSPSFAAAMTHMVGTVHHSVAELGENGQQVRPVPPFAQQAWIIAWAVKSEDQLSARRVSGTQMTDELATLGHPAITVPLSQIWHDVVSACIAILVEEGK